MVFRDADLRKFESIVSETENGMDSLQGMFVLPHVKPKLPEGSSQDFVLGYALGRISGVFSGYYRCEHRSEMKTEEYRESFFLLLDQAERLRRSIGT